jgi:signal transduction histidine kinase
MGMTLDAAGQLLDTSPAAARALLAEARDSSVKALAELRDLVRGIHPPVLADRGLADAVRALALDSALQVGVTSELPARPPAPVESAAYFAVSELLANVSKYARADRVWIDIRYDGATNGGGMLRIGVTDDGRGGADPAGGTGLRGIERRLAAFHGVLAVSSPPGGPTVMNMEIPCALSSPKTSLYRRGPAGRARGAVPGLPVLVLSQYVEQLYLELKVRETERRRLGGNRRAADMPPRVSAPARHR